MKPWEPSKAASGLGTKREVAWHASRQDPRPSAASPRLASVERCLLQQSHASAPSTATPNPSPPHLHQITSTSAFAFRRHRQCLCRDHHISESPPLPLSSASILSAHRLRTPPNPGCQQQTGAQSRRRITQRLDGSWERVDGSSAFTTYTRHHGDVYEWRRDAGGRG